MKKRYTTLLACAALSAPLFAWSQTQADRWYIATDIGTLNMRNSIYADPSSVTLSGGYRFTPYLGGEVGITAVGDSTVTDGNGSRTAKQGDTRALAVGYLPLGEHVELFGKLGLGLQYARVNGTGSYASSDTTYTTTNVIMGAGVQVNFNRRLGMRVQYEQLGKSKSSANDPGADISRVTVGGVFTF
jgi:hypothetical protein